MTVRVRLLVAAGCAAALVGSGLYLERMGPAASPPGPAAADPISGAWSCPHGGGEGWRAWVAIANPGDDPVELRMTTAAGGAAQPAVTSSIEPGALRYVEVGTPLPGSATVVEYLGGVVAAGTVVAPPEGGVAAEPCAGSPGTRWYVTEASTLRGERAELVVHNPFSVQAVVDVVLHVEDRQLRPGRLQGIVLGPQEARAFELNHYVLGARSLGAEVVAPQGRVAAASVVVSPGGVRSSLAVAAPATTWITPGAGPQTHLAVRALPQQDAPVSIEVESATGPLPAVDLEVVPAGTTSSFDLVPADGGLLVSSDGGNPMLAGRRMSLEQAPAPPPAPGGQGVPDEQEEPGQEQGGTGDDRAGQANQQARGDKKETGGGERQKKKEEEPAPVAADLAATSGAPAPARRWLVLPPVGPDGGAATVLLQNPGREPVSTTVSFLGASGPLGTPTEVSIPPHASVRVPVPDDLPAAALVEGQPVVAAQASLTPATFAVTLGLSI